MMPNRQLLQVLSDGAFHSGEEVGGVLGVSRAAVWKQLQGLSELGLEIESVKGRGRRA
jgi:BirA family transcriptional regulator, biotin operon repressor / biotin---[acetyl-CoA-carboxylase] ligase